MGRARTIMRITVLGLLVILLSAVVSYGAAQLILERKIDRLSAAIEALSKVHTSMHYTHRDKNLYRCIDTQIERIRQQGSFAHIDEAFAACDAVIKDNFTLLKSPSRAERFAVFMTLFSHHLAPYGDSNAKTDEEILVAPYQHCGTLSPVTARVIKQQFPQLSVMLVNLYNPQLTNHGIVVITHEKRTLVLDPTTAIIASSDFDAITRGEAVGVKHIAGYYDMKNAQVDHLRLMLRGALMNGGLRASDIVSTTVY